MKITGAQAALTSIAILIYAGQLYGGSIENAPAPAPASAPADGDHDQMPSSSIVCPPGSTPVCLDDGLDDETRRQRLLAMGAVGLGGAYVLHAVGTVTRDAVAFGRVRDLPCYGEVIRNIPDWPVKVPTLGVIRTEIPILGKVNMFASAPLIGDVSMIGEAAGKVTIPTTLGQTPYLGAIIKDIPIAGPVIAGPANPIIVGAAAIDTYWLPKIAPQGYTESAFYTQTDFNSEPTLRHYVNYLAPLPYTHPPVYSASTLHTGHTPNSAAMDTGVESGAAVQIPN